MAKPVNMAGIVVLASLSMSASLAVAQALPDPTRPPDSISAGHGEAAAPPVAGPVLQSVLISSGRKIAIISGQALKLHEKFGDAYLTYIGETEVVLRNGKTEQILKLFPDFKKRPIQSVR